MNFDEFIKKINGKPVDFDGIYPNQCMDLMHEYVYQVLGLTDKYLLSAPSAYMVYTNFRWGDQFEKIKNTPLGLPRKGDLVVWGTEIGEWGHIAIFVEGDLNSFRSFDANFPVGSLPHIQDHDYRGVLGWLRVKDDCQALKDALDAVTLEKDRYKKEAREARITIPEQRKQIKSLSDSLDTLTTLHQKLVDEDKIEDSELIQVIKNFDDLATRYKDQVDYDFNLDNRNLELLTIIEEKEIELTMFKQQKLSIGNILELLFIWIANKLSPRGGADS